MRIENYILRVKTPNNYIPIMNIRAFKLTGKKMIRQTVLKGIPVT